MKTTKILSGITLTLMCSLVASLNAQEIYVAGNNVGEYGLDGSTINASLITGYSDLDGFAISGSDLFLVDYGSSLYAVAEYTTAGVSVNSDLIPTYVLGGFTASGSDLFLANEGGTISETTTSGTVVNDSLFSTGNQPVDIAISGNDIFVVNQVGLYNTIGEYTISGATVNADLISGLRGVQSIAISGNDLFVASVYNSTVGEYNATTGAAINASLISGLSYPESLAISGDDLFVGTGNNGTIGEYDVTTGAAINASFITGVAPEVIAISPAPEPSAGAVAGLGVAALWLWRRRK